MKFQINNSLQLKIGGILSYLTIFLNISIGILYTPWMIKKIGQSDYGLFVLVTSFLSYFVLDFGLGTAIARFVAKYRFEQNDRKINELLGLTTKLYLLIDIVILAILVITYIFIGNIFVKLTPTEIGKFKIVFIVMGFYSIISFPLSSLNGLLIAYEKFILLKLCDFINKVGITSLMIIALLFGFKLYALVIINAFIGLLVLVIKLLYIKKSIKIKISYKYFSKNYLFELFSFSGWITIIYIGQKLLLNIIPAILGILAGTTEIAIFSIGLLLERYTWTIANALNGLFLPKVSAISFNNDSAKNITNLMIRVGRLQLIIIGLLIVGIISFGKEFIIIWVGKNYIKSYYIALLLIIPGLISLTQQIGYTFIIVINKLKYQAFLLIISSIFSIVFSFLFVPIYGALGAAIGISIAITSSTIIGMNLYFWKKIKLDIPRFFKECYLSLSLPILLSLVIGLFIEYYPSTQNILTFIVKVLALSISYLAIMWSFGINESEKILLKKIPRTIIKISV